MILLSDILLELQDVISVLLLLQDMFIVKHFHFAHVRELLVAAGGETPWTDVIVDRCTGSGSPPIPKWNPGATRNGDPWPAPRFPAISLHKGRGTSTTTKVGSPRSGQIIGHRYLLVNVHVTQFQYGTELLGLSYLQFVQTFQKII